MSGLSCTPHLPASSMRLCLPLRSVLRDTEVYRTRHSAFQPKLPTRGSLAIHGTNDNAYR
jgi:hypothetical protein